MLQGSCRCLLLLLQQQLACCQQVTVVLLLLVHGHHSQQHLQGPLHRCQACWTYLGQLHYLHLPLQQHQQDPPLQSPAVKAGSILQGPCHCLPHPQMVRPQGPTQVPLLLLVSQGLCP